MLKLALLSLSPLLAASQSLTQALPLAALALLVPVLCTAALGPLRTRLPFNALILAALALGAASISAASLILQAHSFELNQALMPYLPLLLLPALSCTIEPLTCAQQWRTSLCFALVLVLTSSLREMLGQGSLLSNGQWLFGPSLSGWRLGSGWAFFGHPASAFILLASALILFRYFRQDRHP